MLIFFFSSVKKDSLQSLKISLEKYECEHHYSSQEKKIKYFYSPGYFLGFEVIDKIINLDLFIYLSINTRENLLSSESVFPVEGSSSKY